MDFKDAVKAAKNHIAELFADERVSNLGLEEIEHDDSRNEWKVTIGFSRPWDMTVGALVYAGVAKPNRTYKVVRVLDRDGRILSVSNRDGNGM